LKKSQFAAMPQTGLSKTVGVVPTQFQSAKVEILGKGAWSNHPQYSIFRLRWNNSTSPREMPWLDTIKL
jgi:hypothetical protein